MNRPWFERALAGALAGVPSVDALLRRPGARIADVGCGGGWSTIALARAYPEARWTGSTSTRRRSSWPRQRARPGRRPTGSRSTLADGDEARGEDGRYDAAFAFECVHDMPRPVEVLAAMRRAVRPDGLVVIMDEAVADEFTAPGDELERLMYGFSLLICLPDGMSSAPSVGTGTVMRPAPCAATPRRPASPDVDGAADRGLRLLALLPAPA